MSDKDTINRYILEGIKDGKLDKDISLLILKEINRNREQAREDIAITGIACKFPCAKNAKEYWFNLKNGVEVIRDYPDNRARDLGKKINMKAGWLDDIADFDAGFFRISPKEAISMHPSQRMFLETVWEALEDAGYANEGIYGSNTGVYVGIDHTYQMDYNNMFDEQDLLVMTGSMTSVLASRIAYILNLRGPNLVVDTACSSGLVAMHLACKALKNKECNAAIAGGINLLKKINANFDGVESDDGRLCAFDKNSKGTVWGEGLGFVVLKPLEKAVRDRDNIYAVIKGSAIGNDGTTNGITAPSAETQAETVINAWEDAGIDPETISYMEAHATGTVLGDPIEVKGIRTAFEKYTERKQFCGIGSVKPNIGHGVSAAAVASLLKVVLAMKNAQIPPNINFTEPNPFIDFSNSPLYVNDRLKKWDSGDYPKRAGVSSFGFSRTNCHVVLEEAPKLSESSRNQESYVFTLSARSESALKAYIARYCEFLKESEVFDPGDLCFTANTGRLHYQNRLVMLFKDKEDFTQKLNLLNSSGLENLEGLNIFYGEHRLVSENMKQNQQGELTKNEKREMDKAVAEKMQQLDIKDMPVQQIMKDICRMYVKGAEVKWLELYKGDSCKKISLPTYPFEHKHYWAKKKEDTTSEPKIKESLHPLIDSCLVKTLDQEVYLTEFSTDRHWILTEHVIMGLHVVPGTTYLEMARAAAESLCGGNCMELRNVVFMAPLVVGSDETREVHTIVRREDGFFSFKIASRQNSDQEGTEGAWSVHAEGEIFKEVDKPSGHADMEALRQICGTQELVIDMTLPMGGFTFGPRWRNIRSIHHGENGIFTELALADEFKGDIEKFALHPSLLDNSINLAMEKLVHNIEEGMYLPLSYKSFKIYRPLPARFYSYQKLNTPLVKGIETISMDITLIDEAGEIIAEVKGYVIKKVNEAILKQHDAGHGGELCHTTAWEPQAIISTGKGTGDVLLFRDESGIADKLVKKLRADGRKVIEAGYGEGFKKLEDDKYEVGSDEESYIQLLEEAKGRNMTEIVHIMSVSPKKDAETLFELEEIKKRGIYSLFNLIRALMACKLNKDLDITLVADYVNEVSGKEPYIKPHNAPLFAMGKVAASEYNSLSVRSIDIDESTSAEEIFAELTASEDEYCVAYRQGERYVEKFKELDVEGVSASGVEISDKGVYLITGGTGGIGLEVARRLASKASVNIAFINRSRLPDRNDWERILNEQQDIMLCIKLKALMEIESMGAVVVCCSADVTSFSEMKTVIENLRSKFGRIRGIVHGAGVAGEGLIIRKNEEKFKKVLAPKIEGTWILDRLTRTDKPDFFIMLSSILSMIGVMGQADYASANAYMDSYAVYRRRTAGKTATVNWSVWSETGMAREYKMDEVRGMFKAVTNAMGMEVFDKVLDKNITRLVAGELDYGRIADSGNGIGISLSSELKAKVDKKCAMIKAAERPEGKKQSIQVAIRDEAGANETETKIAQAWAEVLGLEEVNLYDNFSDLGGDSIIAASLFKAINKIFPGALDISDIFTYPSIKLMAAQVSERLGKEKPSAALENEANSDAEIEEIMNRLSRGEISPAEADELIEMYTKAGIR